MYIASNKRFYNSSGELIGSRRSMTGKGKKPPNSKLTDEQVILILQLLLTNELSQSLIGEMFNVSSGTISQIRRNITYTYIDRTKIKPYITFTEETNIEKLEL